MEVSDCPRISASDSRGGGECARGGTRGGCGGSGGGVELREELGALPILLQLGVVVVVVAEVGVWVELGCYRQGAATLLCCDSWRTARVSQPPRLICERNAGCRQRVSFML